MLLIILALGSHRTYGTMCLQCCLFLSFKLYSNLMSIRDLTPMILLHSLISKRPILKNDGNMCSLSRISQEYSEAMMNVSFLLVPYTDLIMKSTLVSRGYFSKMCLIKLVLRLHRTIAACYGYRMYTVSPYLISLPREFFCQYLME